MFVRVVRFSDVTTERVDSLVARIDETGPPPGVSIKKLKLIFDEAQGTAVVLQYFDDEESLRAGAETFAIDPSRRPAAVSRWTRASSRSSAGSSSRRFRIAGRDRVARVLRRRSSPGSGGC